MMGKRGGMVLKTFKCSHCGQTFQEDPGTPQLNWHNVSAGIAGATVGAVAGSVVPGVGTVTGALIGARCAIRTMDNRFECPRCGTVV